MSARSIATQLITSPRVRSAVRAIYAANRPIYGKFIEAYLEPGEPYSELVADILPEFCERYGLQLRARLVAAPEKSAAPEPDKLAAYSELDAMRLREAYAIERLPNPVAAGGEPATNARWRKKRGHYASGMIWFEGEWYWGLDRLHHLERRLGAQGGALLYPPIEEPNRAVGGAFDMFFSLRSPYSYLAMMRAPQLAARWDARIELRPILPMVMRSLPVPREKRMYIVRDCKREAERLGLPFGKIEDPLGAGVERGLAILTRAIQDGKGVDFAQSFLSGVWAEGLNAASDRGLRLIAERAGVDWDYALGAMEDESWRDTVEANRRDLFELGLWGVPSFRVGDKSTFGQDRLWQVGRWLSEASGTKRSA